MLSTILFLVGLIIVFFILGKVIKSIFIFKVFFRLFTIALSLLTIFLIITAVAILIDANDFRSKFSSSDNLFIYADNTTFFTAVDLNNSDKTPFKPVDQSLLSTYLDDYLHSRMDAILSKYYKVMIFNSDSIDAVGTINITHPDVVMTSADIKKILSSANPRDDIANLIASQSKLSKAEALAGISMDNDHIKSYIFSYVVSYYFYPGHISSFLLSMRNSDIIIYRQTAMFTAIRMMPSFLVKDMIPGNATTSILNAGANLTQI